MSGVIGQLRQFELVDSPRTRRKEAVKNAALAAQAAAQLFRGWQLDAEQYGLTTTARIC